MVESLALSSEGERIIAVTAIADESKGEALAARGVEFTHEPRNVTGPLWAANFNDPDGHKLSVFGPERKA